MIITDAYAAASPGRSLSPFRIERREPGPDEVLVEIRYCGVCHTDIHWARGELPGALFPLVPGHEIVGEVRRVGANVRRHAVGDIVGIGCLIDSCRVCDECRMGQQQFCDSQILTYGGVEKDGVTPAYGGFSTHITVTEDFVLHIAPSLDPASAAPLLCAGTTVYTALRHWNVGDGTTVGIAGLGGLGHLAVKMAAAMRADVTVLSTSTTKRDDAFGLGATDFLLTAQADTFTRHAARFDLIVSTVSAALDYDAYLRLLRRDGTLVLLGVPDRPVTLDAFSLMRRRKRVAATPIGGIGETQEMLDFCAAHGISAETELIPISDVNAAFGRIVKNDVRYRFVVDIDSLR